MLNLSIICERAAERFIAAENIAAALFYDEFFFI